MTYHICGTINTQYLPNSVRLFIIHQRIEDIALQNGNTDISTSSMCKMYSLFKNNLILKTIFYIQIEENVIIKDVVLCGHQCTSARVECAFTSPVRTECGMFLMYCMQCCMSVSAVL